MMRSRAHRVSDTEDMTDLAQREAEVLLYQIEDGKRA